PGSLKTYAAPCSEFELTRAFGAPATIVPPDTATADPSKSDAAPSEAVSLVCCGGLAPHPAAGSLNTYAAPCTEFEPTPAPAAPATTVAPDTATEWPSSLPAAPSEAVSFVTCGGLAPHPAAGSLNTYAAPCAGLEPTVARR